MDNNIVELMRSKGFDIRMITLINKELNFYFKDVNEADAAWDYFAVQQKDVYPELDGWYYPLEDREFIEHGLASQVIYCHE